MRKLRRLNHIDKLLVSHIFIAFIIISGFVLWFSKPFNILILHLVLITSAYSIAFIFSRLSRTYFRFLAVTLFSSISTLLLLVYVTNILSNTFWNDNVSLSFIFTYIPDMQAVLEEVPFGIELMLGVLIFVLASITWFYNKHVSYLQRYDHELKLSDFKTYAVVTSFTLIYFYLSFSQTDPGVWEGEPLSGLVLKSDINNYSLDIPVAIEFDENSKTNTGLQNIILIHADALRADHVSGYGYNRKTTPYIDSLIDAGATKIKTGLSTCSESICGMLAALGSQHPDVIQQDTALIHTYLKQAGYRIVFTGSGNFSWERLDSILSHDIDYFARADRAENFSIHDDSIILDTLAKMPEYSGVPTFFFLRFLSSHPIGRHFSKYKKYSPSEKNLLTYLFPSLNSDEILINAYDNNAIQLDDMLRLSIELLTQKGYIDNSLIVIYGDHGEALNEHGHYGHYNNLYQEEIHIPLIFKSSKPINLPSDEFATLNDILPTILDLNQLPVPDTIDGISLLRPTPERTTYHDSRKGIIGLVKKTPTSLFKLIYNIKTREKLLFNLQDDPAEKNNLVQKFPQLTETMLYELSTRFPAKFQH